MVQVPAWMPEQTTTYTTSTDMRADIIWVTPNGVCSRFRATGQGDAMIDGQDSGDWK